MINKSNLRIETCSNSKLDEDILRAASFIVHYIPKHWQNQVHQVFAIPMTFLTPFNDKYHLYLVEIFHQHPVTFLSHVIFNPLLVMCMMILFNQCTALAFPNYEHATFVGGTVLACMLIGYFVIWSIYVDKWLFGYICSILALYLMIAAHCLPLMFPNTFHGLYPLFYAFLCSWCLSIGHVFESHIPPMVSGDMNWKLRDTFVQERSYFELVTALAFGAFDEFLAFPHVFPMLVLRQMCFNHGYQYEFWQQHETIVQSQLVDSQPCVLLAVERNPNAPQHAASSYNWFNEYIFGIPSTIRTPFGPMSPS